MSFKDERFIHGQLPKVFRLAFLMAGYVEGIRRALVLGLVVIAGTAIEQAHTVGPLQWQARSHRPSSFPPGSTNSTTRQSWEDTRLHARPD